MDVSRKGVNLSESLFFFTLQSQELLSFEINSHGCFVLFIKNSVAAGTGSARL